ncbi:LOW QUALITY PROTEIN: hypothetical protein U0070_007140 [Myodes glareolus]|uniref:Uncharacterized protein n=1 Tax=Myodes glareolus TaxID=447135 RepID=A0AAW0JQW3_MYOGA
MDGLLMSAIPRLRALPPNGQTVYATSYGQPPTGYTTPMAPRHTASLSKDMTLVLMTPPLLQPLMLLSLYKAPSVPTQPMASIQQPLHLQYHRKVTSPLRLVPGSYPIQPVTTPPSYPTSYSSSLPTSYNQSSNLADHLWATDHPSSMSVYGQESGEFSGPEENQSISGTDNWGRGRGEFNREGMSREGRGGGHGGIGAGEQSDFYKPGGPMNEGPDLDLGLPIDPDEDSDNSGICKV